MKRNFLIIHVSSPMAFLAMLSDLKFNKINYDKVLVFWTGKNDFPKSIMRDLDINYEFMTIYFFKDYKFKTIKKYIEFSRFLKKFTKEKFEYYLYTHFNEGFFYELIKDRLNIKKENVYLFSDGFETYLVKKRKIKEYLKSIFMLLFNIKFNQSKFLLSFSDNIINLKVIAPELLQKKDNKKHIYNINKIFHKGHHTITKKTDFSFIKNNSALLLTTHSVESNRLSISEYTYIVKKIIFKLQKLGIKNIYFKMHHGEKLSFKRNYYLSLGLYELNSNIPAEIYVACPKFVVLATPYSSAILVCYGLGIYKNIKTIISYSTPKRENSNIKENLIEKVIRKMKVEHVRI